MATYGVDVRTPIFYRQSFASALEAQSSKTYARLTHTPVIAEHLPRGATSGARIAQYATSTVRGLEDLERLLRVVLGDPAYATASANPLNLSTHEPGIEELERTVFSPGGVPTADTSTTNRSQSSELHPPRAPGDGRDEEVATPVHTPSQSPAHSACLLGTGTHETASGHPSTIRFAAPPPQLPRSVSFPTDPTGGTPRLRKQAPAPRSFWQRLRAWAFGKQEPPSSRLSAVQREEAALGKSQRREHTTVQAPPSKAAVARVPAWVRAAFAVSASATAAATVSNKHGPINPRNLRHINTSAERRRGDEDKHREQQQEAVAEACGSPHLDGGVRLVHPAQHLGATSVAAAAAMSVNPISSNPLQCIVSDDTNAGNEASVSNATPSPPALPTPSSTQPPSASTVEDAPLSERLRTGSLGLDGGASKDGTWTGSARTDTYESSSRPTPLSLRLETDAAGSPLTLANHAATDEGRDGTGAAPRTNASNGSTSGDTANTKSVVGTQHGEGCCTALPATELRSGGASFTFNQTWPPRAGEPAPCAAEQPSVLSHPTTAPNSALSRWSRQAYAVELVGWLQLLVWVRCQVIYFLRDLSGVQGSVAWSAWYWSWAREHPRQASLHQALASRRYWRGLWKRGLGIQYIEVQYEISGHMFTLKSVFRLIVSYIGAAYTALEQLNSVIAQVQHNCEMATSPMAAAAAAAAAAVRPHLNAAAAAAGLSTTTLPGMGSSFHPLPHTTVGGAAYRGGDGGGAHVGQLWTPGLPAPNGFPTLTPLPRDGGDNAIATGTSTPALAQPNGRPPVVDDANEVESVAETAAAEAAEEAEATAALSALDDLRQAIWSTLHELKVIFRSNSLELDVLEQNEQFGGMWGAANGGDGRPTALASVGALSAGVALIPSGDSIFFGVTAAAEAVAEALPGSPQMRLCEAGGAPISYGESEGNRPVTARDGAYVLLQCVQRSRHLVLRLNELVQRSHNPPVSRHWQRILFAAAVTVPPFVWLYTKSPAELFAIAQQRYHVAQQLVKTYLLDPMKQLQESLFYVRPGVEDRRGAFDRDALSLANTIRDFHEDMYPDMPLARLEDMRVRTLERLRAGVADPEGLGLIDQQYRHAVRHPVRSVFFGDLPRLLLIQMSYQALEMSRVANGVDEVLEGNDLNFKIMALMPVFAAAGLLLSWAVFRTHASHRPVRMRMKLLWRSLYRVVSFAGSGQRVLPPFMRNDAPLRQREGGQRHGGTEHNAHPQTAHATILSPNSERHEHRKGVRDLLSSAAARTSAALNRRNRMRREGHGENAADSAALTESSDDDDSSSLAASLATREGAASARLLNNYEQGMVLLLSHVIRSMAAEYLRSYEYFHELVEDLNDLESVQSTRRQRIETLERMRATHTSLF